MSAGVTTRRASRAAAELSNAQDAAAEHINNNNSNNHRKSVPSPSPSPSPVNVNALQCSATDGDQAPCDPAASTILKQPKKSETLLDRLDYISAGIILAATTYYGAYHWHGSLSFHHDTSPLLLSHTWSTPLISLALYIAMVHLLGPFLRRNPQDQSVALGISEKGIKLALKYWNLLLAILSICMLFGLGIPLIQFAVVHGPYEAICDSKQARWGGPPFFWMYLFTLSKYIELFDTAFMVLRRKPVSFLHWYHHTSVLAYTWFAVVVGFCPGWYFATINSGVHTIMYFYFYRAACGVRLTYDKLVTTLQLSQMVLGVAITAVWAILHYGVKGGEKDCPCEKAEYAMLAAFIIYGSYFALFLSFYLKRYQKNKSKKAAAATKVE
jgi:elongation of very long chain fatty acids protein 6